MRQFLFVAGALCVIAAMSLVRLHIIDSQYAAVVLSTPMQSPVERMLLPPIPAPIATTTVIALFPEGKSVPAATKPSTAKASTPVVTETPQTAAPAAAAPSANADFTAVNDAARSALVNIICTAPNSEGPVSGSGVIIDPRGVILTNAHVGQYVLLSDSRQVSLTCEARTGSPAKSTWHVSVLYLSSAWMSAHASEIRQQTPLGTGENDYALLRITGTTDGSPLPASLPFLPINTSRSAVDAGQSVLLASYPAGFLGGMTTMSDLDLVSTITTLKQIFTFSKTQITADLVSLGGVIVAQGGSSGGAVVDATKQLVAIIATSSTAPDTANRDLRAITLSHIDRSITSETGTGITGYLSGNLDAIERTFKKTYAPELTKELIDALLNPNNNPTASSTSSQ